MRFYQVQRLEKELLSAQRDMDNMIGLKDQSEKLKVSRWSCKVKDYNGY